MLAAILLSKQPSEVYYYIKEGGERIGKGGEEMGERRFYKILFVFDKWFNT